MEVLRKMDEVGRIIVPLDLRNTLGWNIKTIISVSIQDNCLILKSSLDCCFACGSSKNVLPIHQKFICQKCIDELNIQI